MTPQVFDQQASCLVAEQTTSINGTSSHKFFERLAYQLDNIDEFVNFKKFFVTSLDQDRDRIKLFIE